MQGGKTDAWEINPPPVSLDAASACLPAGAYTTFRTWDGRRKVLGLGAHLRRLAESARGLGWDGTLDQHSLRRGLAAALRDLSTFDTMEARIRLILDTTGQPGRVFILLQILFPLSPDIYTQGVRVRCSGLQRHSPEVKDTDFLQATQSLRQALPPGIFELLLLDGQQRILEGMTSNFYILRQGRLYTAGEGVLAGVTRGIVLALAERLNIPVVLQPPALSELSSLDEAFLTSSSRGVVPVIQVDETVIGSGLPGPLTQRFGAAYDAYILEFAEVILPTEDS